MSHSKDPENSKEEKELIQTRADIDEIDTTLLTLLSRRAKHAQKIGSLKSKQDHAAKAYRPEREAQVLRRVQQENPGPLSKTHVTRLFREIMSACLSLEKPLQVAYLGPPGSFSDSAALKYFGHAANLVPISSIDDIFRELEANNNINYAVIPIENSTEGEIGRSMDLLLPTPLKICGETILRIQQNLMSKADSLAKINKIYSHAQSLGQCHNWLNQNLPDIERIPVSSNSLAAEIAAKEKNAAAIAGDAAAEYYGLEILASNIEDEPDNTTRFIVLGERDATPSGHDKTSLILSAPHKPGALAKMLTAFSEVDISMTRLASRPARGTLWEYVFHVDIEGHRDDMRTKMALQLLNDRAAFVKILGSYPQSTH